MVDKNNLFNLNDSLKKALKQVIKDEQETEKNKLFIKMEKLLNTENKPFK